MAGPRAFISFDFDNNSPSKLYFAGQAKNSRVTFSIEDWSSKFHLPQNQWEELIKAKINKCNFLLVLVGKKTYASLGVIKEIEFAKGHSVPVFGVYVDGTGSLTPLPTGLQRNRTVEWNWELIARAISKVMTEGKNS
jgi:hypothetical protein